MRVAEVGRQITVDAGDKLLYTVVAALNLLKGVIVLLVTIHKVARRRGEQICREEQYGYLGEFHICRNLC